MRSLTAFIWWQLSIVLLAGAAHAQQVQQPVLQNFTVDTVVSVPDRGAAFLGGLSSANAARQSPGPFLPGTSSGFQLSGTHTEVSVFIHDFESMDRVLLAEGQRRLRLGQPELITDRRLRHVLKQSPGFSPSPQAAVNMTRDEALSILRRRR